jgi:hypothetical protein
MDERKVGRRKAGDGDLMYERETHIEKWTS